MTVPWTRTLSHGYALTCGVEQRPVATTAGIIKSHHTLKCQARLKPFTTNVLQYVSTYTKTAELITSYADDFIAASSNLRVEAAAEHLARHAEDVIN